MGVPPRTWKRFGPNRTSRPWTIESLYGACEEPCRAVAALSQGREPAHLVNREVLERPGFRAKLERLAREREA